MAQKAAGQGTAEQISSVGNIKAAFAQEESDLYKDLRAALNKDVLEKIKVQINELLKKLRSSEEQGPPRRRVRPIATGGAWGSGTPRTPQFKPLMPSTPEAPEEEESERASTSTSGGSSGEEEEGE